MGPKLCHNNQELVSIIDPGSNLGILSERVWGRFLQLSTESAHYYAGTRSDSRFSVLKLLLFGNPQKKKGIQNYKVTTRPNVIILKEKGKYKLLDPWRVTSLEIFQMLLT